MPRHYAVCFAWLCYILAIFHHFIWFSIAIFIYLVVVNFETKIIDAIAKYALLKKKEKILINILNTLSSDVLCGDKVEIFFTFRYCDFSVLLAAYEIQKTRKTINPNVEKAIIRSGFWNVYDDKTIGPVEFFKRGKGFKIDKFMAPPRRLIKKNVESPNSDSMPIDILQYQRKHCIFYKE